MDIQNYQDFLNNASQYQQFMQEDDNREDSYHMIKTMGEEMLGQGFPQAISGVYNFVDKVQKLSEQAQKVADNIRSAPNRISDIVRSNLGKLQETGERIKAQGSQALEEGKQFLFKTREQGQQYLNSIMDKKDQQLQNLKDTFETEKGKIRDSINDEVSKFKQDNNIPDETPLTDIQRQPFIDKFNQMKSDLIEKMTPLKENIESDFNENSARITQKIQSLPEAVTEEARTRATPLTEIPRAAEERMQRLRDMDPEEMADRFQRVQMEQPRAPEVPRFDPLEQERAQAIRNAGSQEAQQVLPSIPRAEEASQAMENVARDAENAGAEALQGARTTMTEAQNAVESTATRAISGISQATSDVAANASKAVSSTLAEGEQLAKSTTQGIARTATEGATEAIEGFGDVVPVVGEVIQGITALGFGLYDIFHHPTAPPPEAKADFVSGI
jgi:hypothetical protein